MKRQGAMVIGLAAVGLALAWSEAYPSIPLVAIATPLTYRCGLVPRGSFDRHPWEIRNAGRHPLKIRTYFTGGRSGFSLWQGMTHVVQPGRSIVVHLTWAVPSDRSRPFESLVILKTNDPERPEVRFRVVGTSGL